MIKDRNKIDEFGNPLDSFPSVSFKTLSSFGDLIIDGRNYLQWFCYEMCLRRQSGGGGYQLSFGAISDGREWVWLWTPILRAGYFVNYLMK